MANLDSVLKQLEAAGLVVTTLETDTRNIVRVKVEGDRGKQESGWYRIFSVLSKSGNTYYVGAYGNWKEGSSYTLEYDGGELSLDDRAAIRKKQEEVRKVANEEEVKKRQETALRAGRIFSKLSHEGGSAYLERKKVKAFGVRFSRGAVVVPVQNIDGRLVGLQFIYPDEKGKKFLSGTPKKQCFHVFGELLGAGKVYVAEGYSTAASIHMATKQAVVMAFDSGNLEPVCKALRAKYPKLTIVVCCDDDFKGSHNVGLDKGLAAARAVDGVAIKPIFDGYVPRGTDWNDLHVIAGLTEVKKQIESEIAIIEAEPLHLPKKAERKKEVVIPKQFVVSDKGLFYSGDESSEPVWVCGKIEILAEARTIDESGFGLLVRFTNRDGRLVELNIPRRLLVSERGTSVVEMLVDKGLVVGINKNVKRWIHDYLGGSSTTKRARLVGNRGWHDRAYLLPNRVFGESDELLYYYSDKKPLNRSGQAGTLDGWKDNIGVYCRGNPALMFAVCSAFAAPLLNWLGWHSFGVHFVGESSIGKSTISFAAASVCGGKDYLRTWNTTPTALESIAAEHSDGLLVLDEIGEADPYTIGAVIYMLANGEGRARGTDTGAINRVQHRWRLIFLSNGEHSLAEHVASSGKKTQAGQEVRLLNLPACPHTGKEERQKKGLFSELHGFDHGAKLSDHIQQQAAVHYGHPLIELITYLVSLDKSKKKRLIEYIRKSSNEFTAHHITEAASGQARRAARYFALLGVTGELVSKRGITGWAKGEALRAADAMFQLWLKQRGGEGNAEEAAVLEHIYHELQSKAESHFTRWDKEEGDPVVDTHQPRTSVRWGFRRIDGADQYSADNYTEELFYIDKMAFKKEICKGFDFKRALELLNEKGVLKCHKSRGYTHTTRLPGSGSKTVSVYLVEMSAFQAVFEGSKQEVVDAA